MNNIYMRQGGCLVWMLGRYIGIFILCYLRNVLQFVGTSQVASLDNNRLLWALRMPDVWALLGRHHVDRSEGRALA